MRIDEQNLLELRCKLEKLITKREGMIAENRLNPVLYIEKDFNIIYKQIEELENHISWLGEK